MPMKEGFLHSIPKKIVKLVATESLQNSTALQYEEVEIQEFQQTMTQQPERYFFYFFSFSREN